MTYDRRQRAEGRKLKAAAEGSSRGQKAAGGVLCLNCCRSLVCREVMLSCLARRRLWECKPLLVRTIRGTSSCTPHHTPFHHTLALPYTNCLQLSDALLWIILHRFQPLCCTDSQGSGRFDLDPRWHVSITDLPIRYLKYAVAYAL